jgi:peptidoglycan/LPS O-acetylase OafA/YrhL
MYLNFFPAYQFGLLRFVPCFLPGVIAFARPHTPMVKSYLWLPLLLALTGAYVVIPKIATAWVLCLILGFAIPVFVEIQTGWLRWISNRIATYSYGIYLSHQFAIWVVFDVLRGWPWWGRSGALIALLVGIPVALYHGIEKPLIGVGIRLAERWNARGMVAAEAVQ